MTVEEQNVRSLLERFTPYPPNTVSVADIEQLLPVHRLARSAPSRRWTPLVAAAAVVAVAVAVTLIARSGSSTHRPAHPVPTPTLPLDLGPWRATMVLPGEGELISTGSSLLTLGNDHLVSVVPGRGVRASAQLPRDSGGSLAFDGHNVWVVLYRGDGHAVVLRRYSYPALTLQRSVTLQLGEPMLGPLVGVGAPGEILVGSGTKVATVSSTDLRTLGSLTLDGDVNGLAWRAAGSHLYAAVVPDGNVGEIVEDYARTGPGSYALRQTVPGAGPPLAGALALSDRGLWEISQFQSYNIKFAPFGDLAHPTRVVPARFVPSWLDRHNFGHVTVTVDGGTAWIGGTILGCANADSGQLRTPSHRVVDHTGATSEFGPIASLNGRLYAAYWQLKKGRTLQTGIVSLQPPSACTD